MKRLVLLFILLATPAAAQQIPPTPASCTVAVEQSNLFAYNGRPKNTAEYWCQFYDKDKDYFWKRMLGWMAGGEDVALSGAYANPPSAWFGGSVVLPPEAHPPIIVPPPVDLGPVLARLDQCIAEVRNVGTQVQDVNGQVQAGRKENQSFFASVASEWKNILKYAGPIVGALFAGAQLGK